MTQSSLCTYRNITKNKSNGRNGNRVCKITPHYMAVYWTGHGCADYFASTDRDASANYCIGYDGDIAMSVDEDDRAWTSASGWNDRQAITIECSNCEDSSLTDATWAALVNLCVDICRRYGFHLEYTGDQYGSLTEHRMFAATACPGAWLHDNLPRLAAEVNAALDGKPEEPAQVPGDPVNDSGFAYRAHSQDFGWLPAVRDGQTAGTTGKSKRLEAIKVAPPAGLVLTAKAHIQNKGWVEYKGIKAGESSGEGSSPNDPIIGTVGESLRLEALEFCIEKNTTGKRLRYRVHEAYDGWTGWVWADTATGTVGISKAIEAVQFVLE